MDTQQRILIIEDESTAGFSISEFLEDNGYTAVAAENGKQAISLIEEGPVDLILTDLRIPAVTDSRELLEYMTGEYPEVPVIIISGGKDIPLIVQALKNGAWDYIIKPISDPTILLHSIDQAFEKKRLQKENREYRENLEAMLNERTKELLEAKEYQQRVIDGVSDILLVVKADFSISMLNKAAKEHAVIKALDNEKECYTILKELDIPCDVSRFEHNKPISTEIVLIDPATETATPYEVVSAPLFDDKGTLQEVIHLMRDISIRKKMEEEKSLLEQSLYQAEKTKAIGQLAGGVAHDFNNLLSGIIGGAQLIQLESETDDDSLNKNLGIILKSAENASVLIKKLLAFGRKQTIHYSLHSVHDIIDDTILLLQRTIDKKIKIKSELNADYDVVSGDSSLLLNVFLNLGINASHAMPEGGILTFKSSVEAVCADEKEFNSENLNPGDYLKIEVQDTGSGIAPEILTHIFEPFFTTKTAGKGTGLGLAAAYGTIHQHKGGLFIESEVNEGTTFQIYLPLSRLETEREKEYQQPSVPIEGATILLIDDEEVIRTIGKVYLEKAGYSVLLAENGKTGLHTYQEHKDIIDLVILDMIMPVMDGRECFHELIKINPPIRVLIASGFYKQEKLDDIISKGASGFISKPFNQETFIRKVNEILSLDS